MLKDHVDGRRILDTGDNLSFTATLWTGRHIDVEYPFQALCPGHGLMGRIGCFVHVFSTGAALCTFGRCHISTALTVRGEYAMEPY